MGTARRLVLYLAVIAGLLYALLSFLNTSIVQKQYKDPPIDHAAEEAEAGTLDQQYSHGLISDSQYPNSALHVAVIQDQSTSPQSQSLFKYSAGIVIGRTSKEGEKEKLGWLDNLINVKPYIYLVDDNTTSELHLDRNHGREAAVYFKYIVEFYDELPDISFFWHGDEIVWHNNMLMGWNSTTTINRMDREYILASGYAPSRCDAWPGCPYWVRFDPSRAEDRLDPHRLESLFNPTTFASMFPSLALEDIPPFFAGTCCSQFAVSAATIRSHPRSYYETLLAWTTDPANDDEESGRVLEYTWPFIFIGRGSMCPSMQECYCKTYGFCITENKDLAELERWNALRTRREEVQWQLNFARDALETRILGLRGELDESGESKELSKLKKLGKAGESGESALDLDDTTNDTPEITRIKAALQPEIDRLAKRLEVLAQQTWEVREGIIHYWNLPVPPTGW